MSEIIHLLKILTQAVWIIESRMKNVSINSDK